MIFRRIEDMDSRTICFILRGAPVFTMTGGFILGMVLMGFGVSHTQNKDYVVAGVALLFMLVLFAAARVSRYMADELASRL